MNIKDDFILSQIDEGYLVGGSVRDALMGKSFVDRDIAIKDAEAFAKKNAEKLYMSIYFRLELCHLICVLPVS